MLQVCLYTCGDLIANVPFFEDAEEGFTTSVVTLLRPAVSGFARYISISKMVLRASRLEFGDSLCDLSSCSSLPMLTVIAAECLYDMQDVRSLRHGGVLEGNTHVQVYLKDDMVVREGEVSREMYFIKSGAVQVPTVYHVNLQTCITNPKCAHSPCNKLSMCENKSCDATSEVLLS